MRAAADLVVDVGLRRVEPVVQAEDAAVSGGAEPFARNSAAASRANRRLPAGRRFVDIAIGETEGFHRLRNAVLKHANLFGPSGCGEAFFLGRRKRVTGRAWIVPLERTTKKKRRARGPALERIRRSEKD